MQKSSRRACSPLPRWMPSWRACGPTWTVRGPLWYRTCFSRPMGRYDGVLILEAPDDETAAKFALARGAAGNIRTETLRAFTEAEFRQITAALP
jgi:GYD domain